MAKSDKKTKLPKKVGGVKLPKQLRKSAEVVAEIAQNPVAREVVSAALVAGASALARRKTTAKPAATASSEAKKPGGEFDALIAQGKDVGNMIARGINAFVSALLGPAEKKPAPDAGAAPTKAATPRPTAAKPATKRPVGRPATKTAAAGGTTKKPATARRTAAKPTASGKAPAKPRTKPGPKPKPTT